jgi:hypothetical protein
MINIFLRSVRNEKTPIRLCEWQKNILGKTITLCILYIEPFCNNLFQYQHYFKIPESTIYEPFVVTKADFHKNGSKYL